MKEYVIEWNHTHIGHYMKPSCLVPAVKLDGLIPYLTKLIDHERRLCRIWVNGEIVFYYNSTMATTWPTETVVSEIIKKLERTA